MTGIVTAPSRGDTIVAAFARETRLPYELLVDTSGTVVRALGSDRLPLVALSVLPRSAELTETRPIERFVTELDAITRR